MKIFNYPLLKNTIDSKKWVQRIVIKKTHARYIYLYFKFSNTLNGICFAWLPFSYPKIDRLISCQVTATYQNVSLHQPRAPRAIPLSSSRRCELSYAAYLAVTFEYPPPNIKPKFNYFKSSYTLLDEWYT